MKTVRTHKNWNFLCSSCGLVFTIPIKELLWFDDGDLGSHWYAFCPHCKLKNIINHYQIKGE